ncbi:MAG: RpiB/LacA/LacB family sugar-phosphate isomerase [bacterium]|nr:RpiB/LacA/LacB family sugar-phosphate isomerase [bacterium]
MLYIGADHRGYNLKEEIKKHLDGLKMKYEDIGASILDAQDDYPDYAKEVAQKVAREPEEHRGILLCGSGVGVNIVANKFDGIRAALVWNEKGAKASRIDDNANVLSLPADDLTPEETKKIVKIWLETPFTREDRHYRRIQKIKEIEATN